MEVLSAIHTVAFYPYCRTGPHKHERFLSFHPYCQPYCARTAVPPLSSREAPSTKSQVCKIFKFPPPRPGFGSVTSVTSVTTRILPRALHSWKRDKPVFTEVFAFFGKRAGERTSVPPGEEGRGSDGVSGCRCGGNKFPPPASGG